MGMHEKEEDGDKKGWEGRRQGGSVGRSNISPPVFSSGTPCLYKQTDPRPLV